MSKKNYRLGSWVFAGAVVLSFFNIRVVNAANNICCAYYLGTAKATTCKIAEIGKSDPDFDNTFNSLKDPFPCSSYSAKDNFVTHKNGDITVGGKTGFAVGPNQVIYPSNLKGNFEWSAPSLQGATTANACPKISGYNPELIQVDSPICKVADMERKSADQAFQDKLSEAILAAQSDYDKFYQSLQDTQKVLCCLPNNPNKNNLAIDCKPPQIKDEFKPEVIKNKAQGLNSVSSFQQISPNTANPNDVKVAQYFSCDYLPTGTSEYTLVLRNTNIYCLCTKDRSACDTKSYLQMADTATTVGCSAALNEKQKSSANLQWECVVSSAIDEPGTTDFCKKLVKGNVEIVNNISQGVDVTQLNQLGTTDAKELIARAIKGILGVLGSLSLVMFIYGGILLMTDRGNSDQTGKAKDILVWTTLGLAVIFAAYAIVDFVFGAFS